MVVNSRQKQQQKQQQRRPRGKLAAAPGGANKLATEICSVTDPFCPHAEGAYSPYGTNQMTIPVTFKGFSSLTTNTEGNAALLFRASQSTVAFTRKNDLGAVVNIAAYTDSAGTFPTFTSEARVISAGIQWHCVVPATAAGGTLAVVPVQNDANIVGGGSISYANLTTTPGTQLTDLRSSGSFVFAPTDLTSREFADTSATTGVYTPDSWNAVMLLVSGPVSQATINFSWYIHYECLINASQGISLGKAVQPKPLVVRAIEALGSNYGGYYEGAKAQVTAQIKAFGSRAAKLLLTKAITYGGNYLMPGAGTAAGAGMMIMDVD